MDERDMERLEELPDHERRGIEGQSVGGGVMGTGGTAVDRGTGTLRGTAQGMPDEEEDVDDAGAALDDETIVDTPADVATLHDEAADR